VDLRGLPARENGSKESPGADERPRTRRGPESTEGKRTASTPRAGSTVRGSPLRASRHGAGLNPPSPTILLAGNPVQSPRASGLAVRASPSCDRPGSGPSLVPRKRGAIRSVHRLWDRDRIIPRQGVSFLRRGEGDVRPPFCHQPVPPFVGIPGERELVDKTIFSVPASREARTRRIILAVEGSGRESTVGISRVSSCGSLRLSSVGWTVTPRDPGNPNRPLTMGAEPLGAASISPPIRPVNLCPEDPSHSAGVTRPKISGPHDRVVRESAPSSAVFPLRDRELSVQRILSVRPRAIRIGFSSLNSADPCNPGWMPPWTNQRVQSKRPRGRGLVPSRGNYAPEWHSMERHAPVSTGKPSCPSST